MFDGLDTDSCGDVAFAGAGGAPNQNNVFCILYELTTMKLPYSGLVDIA